MEIYKRLHFLIKSSMNLKLRIGKGDTSTSPVLQKAVLQDLIVLLAKDLSLGSAQAEISQKILEISQKLLKSRRN
jgi:hypothetical protein